jgi:hypothetical protein
MRRTPLKRKTPLRASGTLRRGKKKRPPNLKNILWRLFSEYIRRRYADHAGNAICVSCDKVAHWKLQHPGHFVRASAGMNTYFDEQNVNVQCVRCNIFLDGNMAAYALYMVKTYGNDILAALDERRRVVRKISTPEYLELIEAYKSKLRALENREAA